LNTGKVIRKILFVSMWLVIGGGMVILLVAAIGKQKKDQCRDYSITIKGSQNIFFVDKKEVEQLLKAATKGDIKGQPLASFNLHQLEQLLEDNNWINDAELYFDNRNVLYITVIEREPVARIFTTEGTSYYIDSKARRMPLSDKMSARVPVFTGFPEKKVLTVKDSVLLADVKTMAEFINNDPFWVTQVSQIDITADRNFEMIPVVGNHLVKLGNGEDIAQKFHRLFVFYNQVLSKTGFEKYKTIDVQYAGQVVASKQTGTAKVDSVQLRKNVEKLLLQSQQAQDDTVTITKTITEKPIIKIDSATVPTTDLKVTAGKSNLPAPKESLRTVKAEKKSTSPNPVKSSLKSKPVEKKSTDPPKQENEIKKPKAVMSKKIVEDNGGY
jgi:cell division protein FtsQ